MGIINQYPYTDLHSINLDYIIKLCRENMGLHLEISGNQLLLKTEAGSVISSVTIHYAEEAGHAATATSATSAASATNATNAQNATYATNAAHAVSADTATVAASANQAASATTAASAASADYATTAGSAATATRATSAASADYAETTGSVDHAEKAIETVVSSGNNLIFTTYDGTQISITAPFSTKANRDNNGNVIASTYIAGVVDDNGTLKFLDGNGNTVVSITPTSASAASDTYGNTIADFVKTITAPNDSNYITVSHGTGTAETLTVNYSNQAWKDTNGNVIKNTYIKDLECVEDENDGHYKLVAYNGDDPQAELFRTELKAYSAQVADLAAEATHALSADHATAADSATTAATSTGSVSSISASRNILTINNGDGTSSTVNMFRGSQVYLYLNDDSGNTNLLDSSFTIGHSEEFVCSNYSVWGYSNAIGVIRNLMGYGVEIMYSGDSSDPSATGFFTGVTCYIPSAGQSNYIITVFDKTAAAIKAFEIEEPADVVSNPGNLKVTRLL